VLKLAKLLQISFICEYLIWNFGDFLLFDCMNILFIVLVLVSDR
jgi:hypothetical protein